MSEKTSKNILTIFGLLGIFFGGITSAVFLLMTIGGGLLSAQHGDENRAFGGLFLVLGIYFLVAGLIVLIQGIFSFIASRNSAKVMPCWILSMISIAANVISLISTDSDDKKFVSVIALIISVVTFIAANTVRKNRKRDNI